MPRNTPNHSCYYTAEEVAERLGIKVDGFHGFIASGESACRLSMTLKMHANHRYPNHGDDNESNDMAKTSVTIT